MSALRSVAAAVVLAMCSAVVTAETEGCARCDDCGPVSASCSDACGACHVSAVVARESVCLQRLAVVPAGEDLGEARRGITREPFHPPVG